ncbi:MAG: YdcF family protein [Stellaceae bacterium]
MSVALAGLVVLSLPDTARLLVWLLERGLPLAPPPGEKPGAIVILSGDVAHEAGGGVTVGALTLERLRTGARLARATGLPILVSGGAINAGEPTLAQLMARSLKRDFATPATWIEARSKDTWQNARFSAAILRRHHIDAIYLVTNAWHMRRALIAFAPLPVAVTAAPTLLDPPPELAWSDFVPQAKAWHMSYYALHEWIGIAYYKLREW